MAMRYRLDLGRPTEEVLRAVLGTSEKETTQFIVGRRG